MPGIQLSGLASGLDTQSIIDQLMSIERQPRTRIEMRQATEQARRDGLDDVATKLKTLKLATTDLRSIATWADTQSATSSDTSKVDVRRTGGAGPGGYDVAVTRLASSTQRTYTYAPPAAGTTLTFTVKDAAGNDVPTSIDIAAGASLDDAVSTINTTAGSPVYAVNVSGNLVLASRTTGENARFTMADSAGGTLTQQSERLGQNALLTVDGQDYESQSNVASGIVPGLELTLKGTTGGVQLNVGAPGPDPATVSSTVKAFVDAYNAVVDSIRSKVTEQPVPTASTAADAAKGALYGDAGLNSLLNQLRQGVSDIVPGNSSTLDQFAELGVSTGASSGTINADSVAGKLTFDPDKLQAALDADPLAVRRLLGGVNGSPGLSQRFEGIIGPVANTGGTLDQRIASEDSALSDIARQLSDFDERMTAKEDSLNRQYTALETALAQAQSRASDLSGLPATS